MQYAMIVEKGERNYSAYFPDLPGCVATGQTLKELKQAMREALELHLRPCVKMDCPSRSQAWWSMSKLRSGFAGPLTPAIQEIA
jgi:hypothetical protein